jgi:hypothetical protein
MLYYINYRVYPSQISLYGIRVFVSVIPTASNPNPIFPVQKQANPGS